MRMSDLFELPTYVGTDVNDYGCLEDKNTRHITTFAQHEIEVDDSIEILEYAAHAINNHDRLTEENAKLREALESLAKSASVNEEQLNDLLMCGDYGESKELCDAKQLINKLKDQNNGK